VGTWVYASPLRPAWSTAWEAHSLSVVTEGRFEMGVGTGRPGIEDELRDLGMPVVPSSEQLTQVRETVTILRELDSPALHTPVVMAVHGPKAQALAADLADTIRSRSHYCPVRHEPTSSSWCAPSGHPGHRAVAARRGHQRRCRAVHGTSR
jgi:alkanesulfonate monooxygenase SsuD/methylene tetrahydromethanopterin reductase-like flavin-dependent oxidoreductase (luciferase family)